MSKKYLFCGKCGTELIHESIETYNHNQNGEPLYVFVWLCPVCDFGGKNDHVN